MVGFCCALMACGPIPVLQDARIVPKGRRRMGVALGIAVPTDSETYFEPDGEGSGDRRDYQWHPLAHVMGWIRAGFGIVEVQAAFQLPVFMITGATKVGVVGREAGSPFALAISADLGVSPVFGSLAYGGSLHLSVRLSDEVGLDLMGRGGTSGPLWNDPTVTSTLGVSIGQGKQIHVVAGYVASFGEDSPPALWLGGGVSW